MTHAQFKIKIEQEILVEKKVPFFGKSYFDILHDNNGKIDTTITELDDFIILSLISMEPIDFAETIIRLQGNVDELSDRLIDLAQMISSDPPQQKMWKWMMETNFENERFIRLFPSIDYAYCIHHFWQQQDKLTLHRICRLNPQILSELIQRNLSWVGYRSPNTIEAMNTIIENKWVDLDYRYRNHETGKDESLLSLIIHYGLFQFSLKFDSSNLTPAENHAMLKRIIGTDFSRQIDDDAQTIGMILLDKLDLSIVQLWKDFRCHLGAHNKRLYDAANRYRVKCGTLYEKIIEYFDYVKFNKLSKTQQSRNHVSNFHQKYPTLRADGLIKICECFDNTADYINDCNEFLPNCYNNASFSELKAICEKIDAHCKFLEANGFAHGSNNILVRPCTCFEPTK